MKTFSVLLLLFITITPYAQSNTCDSIIWKNTNKLTKENFRTATPTNIKESDAFSAIILTYKSVRLDKDDSLKIKVSCYFHPCLSWLHDKPTTMPILIREQIKFDVAEYYRRIFIKTILAHPFSKDAFSTEIAALFADISKEKETVLAAYDKEAALNTTPESQIIWAEKISKKVIDLAAYDKPVIAVSLLD